MINIEEHLRGIERLKSENPYASSYVILCTHVVGKHFPIEDIDELINNFLAICDNEMYEQIKRLNGVEKKEFDKRRDR